MFNQFPYNAVEYNGFKQNSLLDFSEAVQSDPQAAIAVSWPIADGFAYQDTLETWRSLVLNEALDIQALSDTQLYLSIEMAESLHVADESRVLYIIELASSFAINDTLVIDPNLVFNVTESLVTTGVCSTQLVAAMALAEALAVTTTLTTASAITYDESLGVATELTTSSRIIIAVLESLVMQDSQENTLRAAVELLESVVIQDGMTAALRAVITIAEALEVEAEAKSSIALSMLESLGVSADADTVKRSVISILETYLMEDAAVATARFYFEPTESLALSDDVDIGAILALSFAEEINFSGVINLPGEGSYTAWVLNSETRAIWQYENFPFNSFCKKDGRYFGLTDSALYELTGSDDDGANIDAVIKTGLMNFGSMMRKSIPRAYIGYKADGSILLKTVSTDSRTTHVDTGNKVERWYQLEAKPDDTTVARKKMARGVKAVYWQFEITNVDGADFDIDTIAMLPVILNRRI